MRYLVFVFITLIFVGCSSSNTYVVDNNGHLRRVASGREDGLKYEIDWAIDLELAGRLPPAPWATKHNAEALKARFKETWREYWHKCVGFVPGSADLGTREQVLAYIKQRRRARGLPAM